jgi:hypothetical protein
MSIKAMRQALEALENVRSYDKQDLYGLDEDITALRTAIEQIEKPVAYRWKGELFTPGEIEMLDVTDAVPLYEHPREWRNVPQEEFDMLMDEVFSVTDQMMFGHNVWEFYEICEARLKELNTMQGNNEVIGKWIEKRREGEAI